MIQKSTAFVNVGLSCFFISYWIVEIIQGISRSVWLPQLFLIIPSLILIIPSIIHLLSPSEKISKIYLSIAYWFVLLIAFIPVCWIGILRLGEFKFFLVMNLITPICAILYLKNSKHQQLWKNEIFRFNFFAIVAQIYLLFLNVYL
jgi:hypothetical protein